MKKSLLALAVAGAFAAPLSALAQASNVTVYGKIDASYARLDNGATADDDGSFVTSNNTYFGLKGTEDLGNGLKGLFQAEWTWAHDSTVTGLTNRNSFVGLGGGWGRVILGRNESPIKSSMFGIDPFADTVGDMNNIIGSVPGTANIFEQRNSNVIQYDSPTWNAFRGSLQWAAPESLTPAGGGHRTGGNIIYEQGPIYAALGYERCRNIAACGATAPAVTSNDDKSHAARLGLGYNFGPTRLGFIYENMDGPSGSVLDRNAWLLNVSHKIGKFGLMAQYTKADDGDSAADTSAHSWALGGSYDFSKRTSAILAVTKVTNDSGGTYGINGSGWGQALAPTAGDDPRGLSLTVRHKF